MGIHIPSVLNSPDLFNPHNVHYRLVRTELYVKMPKPCKSAL